MFARFECRIDLRLSGVRLAVCTSYINLRQEEAAHSPLYGVTMCETGGGLTLLAKIVLLIRLMKYELLKYFDSQKPGKRKRAKVNTGATSRASQASREMHKKAMGVMQIVFMTRGVVSTMEPSW